MHRVVLGVMALALLATAVPAGAQQAPETLLGVPTDDPSTAMSLVWSSQTPQPGAAVVVDGPDGEATYAAEVVTGPSAEVVYEARLDGLRPGATYTYSMGGDEFAFTAPPANLSAGDHVRIVALGDMGTTSISQATVATILDLDPDLVLHAGDISYAEGDQVEWRTWFDMARPVTATRPWLTAIGNHEVGPLGVGNTPASTEVQYYKQRFSLPDNEQWWSTNWAGVHVVALDTFSDALQPTQEQIDWLADDLAANADALWTIVFLHEPPYSSNNHGSSPRVQDAFVDVFDEHGVDLVIGGHDHGYERTYPMRAGEVTNTDPGRYAEGDGVVYLVTGGGGISLYRDWTDPAPEWSAYRESLYHVTDLIVTPQRIVGRVVPTTDDGDGDDSFTIWKADAMPAGADAGGATDGGGGDGGESSTPLVAPLVAVAALGGVAVLRRRS